MVQNTDKVEIVVTHSNFAYFCIEHHVIRSELLAYFCTLD